MRRVLYDWLIWWSDALRDLAFWIDPIPGFEPAQHDGYVVEKNPR